ncbi:MAG: insulinase family protein [Deltaproteobacteria bacterium]|nr:insulinase family protein [Deltaproteobacteria bacterium]
MVSKDAAASVDAAAGVRIDKTTLPNGIRILSERTPGMVSAAIGLWIESGSRYEGATENGLSHFLEHLFFKGTERRSAAEIAEAIDAVGGVLNADTDREHTCYYAKVLGEHVPLAVDLLSDIFLASRFAPEEIARERDVVLEEIAQIEDTPDDLINDLFHQAYWPGHALGRPVCGTRDTVAGFDRDVCRAWVQRRYRPDRLVVAAAGDVEHDALVEEIARRFGDLSGSAPVEDGDWPVPARGVTVHRRRLEQVQLCFATRGVAVGDPDRDAAVVLNSVLGDSPSSRLFQEVRERRGRAYSIDSFLCSYRDTGYLGIAAGTRPRWVAEVVEIVVGELRRIRREGIPTAELARAKGKLRGTLLLGLETSDQRMERLALHEMYFGRQVATDELAARLEAVTNDQVVATAARLFTPESCALVLLGDVKERVLDTDVFGGLLA